MHPFEGEGIIQPFHRVSANPACPGFLNLLWTFTKRWRLALAAPVHLGQKRAAFPCQGKSAGKAAERSGGGGERFQGPVTSRWNGFAGYFTSGRGHRSPAGG